LLFVAPSVWQMLRGSNILFTGILSVVFLKRRLYAYSWIGMARRRRRTEIVGISLTIAWRL
jgi:hypothetical protein